MTSFLSRIFSVFKAKENGPKDISVTVNIMGKEPTVNSVDIHSSKEDLAALHVRRTRSYRRYDRLMRHKKIWAILDYAKSLESLYASNSFNDLDKALIEYQNAFARFDDSDFRPSEVEIQCAFRFCDIQYCIGECQHHLTETEKQNISNLRPVTLDYAHITKVVSQRFIEYWDKVLHDYKNKKAYTKRLEYLIGHLDEVRNRKTLSSIPEIEESIENLRTYYQDLQTKSHNSMN